MIEITIKTLDSQNHSFSVDDDTTVKQFKEKIFEKLPFPVDSQRLIHCGRVLQDDKKLSEYDVNGKVIHLVQRPPPQPSGSSTGAAASARTNGSRVRSGSAGREYRMGSRGQMFRSRLDGSNAMYLGAMAIPAEVMDASGITMPQPSQSLSQSRLSVARRMIRSASATLTLLENAENGGTPAAEPGTPPAEPAAPPAEEAAAPDANTAPPGTAEPGTATTSREVGIILVTNNESPEGPSREGLGFLQPSTAAVIASAFSAARSSGIASHMTISRQSPGAEAVSLSVDMDAQGNITHVNGDNFEAGTSSSSSAESTSPPQEPADGVGAEGGAEGGAEQPPLQRRMSRQGYARPAALATLVEDLNRVNDRLRPFSERFQQLLQSDPALEGNEALAANFVFTHVSEVMHCLSHANHAISDIMCEYTQPPPRVLRCRPVLIQHSAVLQAGIPVGAFSMMANRAGAQAAHAEAQAAASAQAAAGVGVAASAPPPPETTLPPPPPPPPRDPPAANPQTPDATGGPQAHRHFIQPRVRILRSHANSRGPTTVSSMSPNNIEFVMEVAPGSITIDSVEATLMSGAGAMPLGAFGSMDGGVLGENNFPWGPSAAPPEFLQNLMQAVAGHMMDRSQEAAANASAAGSATTAANSTTTSTTSGSADATAASAAGQTSQARGNTATHPTTSTQTRSTSRPHVHLAQSMGSFGANAFDPFLPCNSHHVVRASRRTRRLASRIRPEESNPMAGYHIPMGQVNVDADDLLSNLINGIVDGYERDGFPAEPTSGPTSAAAGPGARPTAATNTPMSPFYNVLNALLSGEGAMPNGDVDAPATALPLIQQIIQGLGGAILGRTAGSSLADILRSMPDHSLREGESLVTDFIMAVAGNLTLHDMLAVSMGRIEILNNLLPSVRDFVQRRVLENEPATPENIGRGAERLTSGIGPFLDILMESNLREDVDVLQTVRNYNNLRVAEFIRAVTGESRLLFGLWGTNWFRSYLRELFGILRHCCVDGITGLETLLLRYLRLLTSSMPAAIQEWTVTSSLADLRTYMYGLNIGDDPVPIRHLLVLRSPEEPTAAREEPQTTAAAAVVHSQVGSEPTQVHVADEPMETDAPLVSTEAILVASSNLPALVPVPDPVPVIIPETWHNALPSDWVPIIARDSQRQRRQNPQAPFSDAYLSDMPSKRRKVVTSSKPQGSLNQVIAESVRSAVGVVGVPPNAPNVESVAETAGLDPLVQAAYREQVRATVRDNITNNSDFVPEKYPNTAKYFTKK